MNLSGILVVAGKGSQADVIAQLETLPGVEVHHVDSTSGRIVVTLEAEDIQTEVEGLRRIKALPHIALAEMVYHYFAEDTAEHTELPPDLAAQDTSCAVPVFLMD